MAQRRDQGFGVIFSQLRPLKWLVGISFIVLMVALVMLFFFQDKGSSGPKAFVLMDGEVLRQDRDFHVRQYAQDELATKLPLEYADRTKKNMDVIEITHVELVDPKKSFSKGFIVRFYKPEGEVSAGTYAKRGLRVGYWSMLSEAWLPKQLAINNDGSDVIYTMTERNPGFFALGYFNDGRSQPEVEATETPQDAAKDAANDAAKDPKGDAAKDATAQQPAPATLGLSLRIPVMVRGEQGLRKSEHLALWLSGLSDANPEQPVADLGATVVAEIRGDPSQEPLIDPSLQLRWYISRSDREQGICEQENLLNARIWSFDKTPTHLPAEWLISFEIVDITDGRVYAEAEIPLSVRDPQNG